MQLRVAGGNGVAVSRYARDVVIANNEMHRIGDTGVVVVGDLKYDTPTPWVHVDGNYLVGTAVVGNLIHELGVSQPTPLPLPLEPHPHPKSFTPNHCVRRNFSHLRPQGFLGKFGSIHARLHTLVPPPDMIRT